MEKNQRTKKKSENNYMCMYKVSRGFEDIDEYIKYFVYSNDVIILYD